MKSHYPWENGEKLFFTNDEGYEWYMNEYDTEWAHSADSFGTTLPNLICIYIRKGDFATRGMMDKITNELIYTDTSMEGIAVKIDMLKFIKRCDDVQDDE